ncbi:hypothetical protein [Nocardia sp. NPDC005978]|uniref:hypothetical protein n=1 Tax=unclassified Nocardia TaxID=2637762 RepID=UPI0033AB0C90
MTFLGAAAVAGAAVLAGTGTANAYYPYDVELGSCYGYLDTKITGNADEARAVGRQDWFEQSGICRFWLERKTPDYAYKRVSDVYTSPSGLDVKRTGWHWNGSPSDSVLSRVCVKNVSTNQTKCGTGH